MNSLRSSMREYCRLVMTCEQEVETRRRLSLLASSNSKSSFVVYETVAQSFSLIYRTIMQKYESWIRGKDLSVLFAFSKLESKKLF
jgi:hypothetical protein